MMESYFDLTVGLSIMTEEPPEFITKILGVYPTKCLRKGEGYFAFSEKVDNNVWILRKRYKEQTDVGTCIQEFFGHIPEYMSKICEVKRYGSCTFRLSIVSEYGQLGFSLTQNNIRILNELSIPLEVTIFSYGSCVNE